MARVKILVLLCLMSLIYFGCVSEKVTYMSTEHPRVTYINKKYVKFANLTSNRYGRRNPVYYVGLHFISLIPLDNNIHVDFYLYEWLTNVYKPSFVEFHISWCELIEKDQMFGSAMKQGKLKNMRCPYPPGEYHLVNMTVNPMYIPRGFPFTRGRIYANLTISKTKERVAEGYIDMKLEHINKKAAQDLFSPS